MAKQIIAYYATNKDTNLLKKANTQLKACEKFLKDNDLDDIRNEALYYRLQTIYSVYINDFEKAQEFCQKAMKNYEMMNCKKDIESLLGMLNR